ncbi:hypothetical protein [Pleionea litopenaei]|uniref:Uncharacterized protein n=1 Tax=Pleionea litopenaei TaxID=3070815 RepID=A0AA51X6L3_9GAMM|nr:hypothetical protein [Pleionea sp. HL-JVS1]WMS87248.1 hypothetical protein Q9312_18745 [Pleionea sp. HL-JVS1]
MKVFSKKEFGFGLTEYLVGLIGFIAILVVPIKDGKSVGKLLIDAVKREHAAYIYTASLTNIPENLPVPKKKK